MSKTIAFLLIPFSIVFFAFSSEKSSGTLGIYDADSVYTAMPRYQQALIECAKRDSLYQANRDTMRIHRKRYAATVEENAKTDSPVLHSLRLKQLADLDTSIVHLNGSIREDSINSRNAFMRPVYTVTLVTAEYLRKEKNYVAVLKKNELDSFRTANPGEYEIVNVTGEMIIKTK